MVRLLCMLHTLEQLSPAWLEKTLGVPLSRYSVREAPAFNSSIAHLELEYSAPSDLPRRLLLKLNRDFDGQNEVRFYRLASPMSLLVLPRFIAADCDEVTGHSFLLLEDLSETHFPPVTREQLLALEGVPAQTHMHAGMDTLAAFQAAFWEHPSFNTIPDLTQMRWWYRDAEFHARHVQRRADEWAQFRESFAEGVPPDWLSLCESGLANLPGLFGRCIQPRLDSLRALTLS